MIARRRARPAARPQHGRGRRAGLIGPLAVAGVVLFAAPPARAQSAGPAQPGGSGWWLGGGGGYLAGRVDCSNCEEDKPYGNGGALLVQGGLRVNERVLAGGEVFVIQRKVGQVQVRNTFLLGLVQFHPLAAHGFFIKLGYGMAVVKDSFTVEGTDVTARAWGMGVMYGAGWVFRRARRVSFAPVAAHYITTIGDIQTASGAAQGVVGNGWFLGGVVTVR